MPRPSKGNAARNISVTVKINQHMQEYLTKRYGSPGRGLWHLAEADRLAYRPEAATDTIDRVEGAITMTDQTGMFTTVSDTAPLPVEGGADAHVVLADTPVVVGGKSTGHRHKAGKEPVGEKYADGDRFLQYQCSVAGCGALLPWRRA